MIDTLEFENIKRNCLTNAIEISKITSPTILGSALLPIIEKHYFESIGNILASLGELQNYEAEDLLDVFEPLVKPYYDNIDNYCKEVHKVSYFDKYVFGFTTVMLELLNPKTIAEVEPDPNKIKKYYSQY